MNTTMTDTDLRTPPEWAEHYGISGLLAEEWQAHARVRPEGASSMSDWTEAPEPDWERPMTAAEFRRILHGTWTPTLEDGRRGRSVDRSKKMPKFAPTAEAVRDALAQFRGWVATSKITQVLAEPQGWHNYDLPPNTKVNAHLKALALEGIVIEESAATDRDRLPNAVRGEGNSKMWMLTTVYDGLRADRALDIAEEGRRREKLLGWVMAYDPTLGGEIEYNHGRQIRYVDGEFDAAADHGRVSMPWEALERIINLTPRPGPSRG